MAYRPDYQTGVISLTNGSTALVGSGTFFDIAPIRDGDMLWCVVGGEQYCVAIGADATSATALTLARPWPGPSLSNVNYRILLKADSERNTAATVRVLELLSRNAFFKYDASGVTADRAQYDGKPQGFSFLDVTTDPATLYIKKSNASGDWAGPYSWSVGEKGDTGKGIVPRGAWSNVTTYAAADSVSHNGRSFASKVDGNANHQPPNSNSDDAFWAFIPSGAGDVVAANNLSELTDKAAALNTLNGLSKSGGTITGNLAVGGRAAVGNITISSDYALVAKPDAAAIGAVLGWSRDGTIYSILGYNNTHSFLGKGILQNDGEGRFTGSVNVGGATLSEDGNIVGAAWGYWGNTSAFHAIDGRISNRAQMMHADLGTGAVGTYAMVRHALGYGLNLSTNYAAADLLFSGTDNVGAAGISGTWRIQGQTSTANHSTLAIRVA